MTEKQEIKKLRSELKTVYGLLKERKEERDHYEVQCDKFKFVLNSVIKKLRSLPLVYNSKGKVVFDSFAYSQKLSGVLKNG